MWTRTTHTDSQQNNYYSNSPISPTCTVHFFSRDLTLFLFYLKFVPSKKPIYVSMLLYNQWKKIKNRREKTSTELIAIVFIQYEMCVHWSIDMKTFLRSVCHGLCIHLTLLILLLVIVWQNQFVSETVRCNTHTHTNYTVCVLFVCHFCDPCEKLHFRISILLKMPNIQKILHRWMMDDFVFKYI